MQDVLTNQDIENFDLSKVAALQQKRTLAFVNHFVITTVQFLNTFSKTCEKKFKQFEEKLEKVDAAMVLLEARLSSIPEVNDISQVNEEPIDNSESQIKSVDQSDFTVEETSVVTEDNPDADGSKTAKTIQTKQEFERFIKMVQVGVPLQAVKLKASMEGLDPDELDILLKK